MKLLQETFHFLLIPTLPLNKTDLNLLAYLEMCNKNTLIIMGFKFLIKDKIFQVPIKLKVVYSIGKCFFFANKTHYLVTVNIVNKGITPTYLQTSIFTKQQALFLSIRCIRYILFLSTQLIRPFYKACAPVRLCLPVTQESTKSLKALLVLHAKTFELTKPSIMQVIILK